MGNTLNNNIEDCNNDELLINLLGDEDMVIVEVTNDSVMEENLTTPNKDDFIEESFSTIPTPFKRNLFWPEPKPKLEKRAAKYKMPAVAVSDQWISYHENKKIKKTNDEKIKLEKKRMHQDIIKKKLI